MGGGECPNQFIARKRQSSCVLTTLVDLKTDGNRMLNGARARCYGNLIGAWLALLSLRITPAGASSATADLHRKEKREETRNHSKDRFLVSAAPVFDSGKNETR